MKNLSLRFVEHLEKLPQMLVTLTTQTAILLSEIRQLPTCGAIYAIHENNRPLYVGRTKNLLQRMRNQTSGDPAQAAFAFKLTRESMDRIKPAYKPEGSRKQLMEQPEFRDAFQSHTERIKAMSVKYVEVKDPIDQYLFELYAAMELHTPYNDFGTT